MVRATLHEQEIRQAIGVPGEGDAVVDGLASLDEPHDRYLYWCNERGAVTARESLAPRMGCIVIAPNGSGLVGELGDSRILEVPDPRAALAKVLAQIEALGRQPAWVDERYISPRARISPHAVVEGEVTIGDGVEIEPFCTVGPDVSIGRGSVLRAGVRVYPRVSIGEESFVGTNSVIGLEGSGHVRDEAGNTTRIPHLGGVVIGSHVEIGALAGVESGAITPTTIEDHATVGGMTAVAHGARVERGATIAGGVVLAGSSVVGAEAWVGINSTVREGRRIGSRALVGMDVSVQEDLPDDAIARAPRPDVAKRPPDDDRAAIGFASRTARRPS